MSKVLQFIKECFIDGLRIVSLFVVIAAGAILLSGSIVAIIQPTVPLTVKLPLIVLIVFIAGFVSRFLREKF